MQSMRGLHATYEGYKSRVNRRILVLMACESSLLPWLLWICSFERTLGLEVKCLKPQFYDQFPLYENIDLLERICSSISLSVYTFTFLFICQCLFTLYLSISLFRSVHILPYQVNKFDLSIHLSMSIHSLSIYFLIPFYTYLALPS